MISFVFHLPLAAFIAASVYYTHDFFIYEAVFPFLPLAVLASAGLSAGAAAWSASKQDEVAGRNRDWQSEENEKNRQFQHDEWLSQFNSVNEYNDPAKQVQRLSKAGISPAAAFGAGAGSIGQSMASPSSPSGASTSVTSPYVDSDYYNPWRIAESLGSALQKFSDVPYNLRNSEKVQAEAAKLVADTDIARIDKQAREFELNVRKIFANDQEAQKYMNSMMEYNVLVQTARRYSAEANNEEARKTLIEAQAMKEKTLSQLQGETKRLTSLQADYYAKSAESEIAKNQAQATESYAAANLSDKQSHFQYLTNQIKERTINAETYYTLRQMRAKGQISNKQYQEASNELARLKKVSQGYRKSNSMVTIDAGIENLRKILGFSVGVSYSGNEK